LAFVQFSKVSLAFGDRDILKDVSVNLATGTKAALTGANGCGKSTLMKVFAGLIESEGGERAVQKDTRIVYLPQSGIVHHGTTLKEEADKAFAYGYSLHAEMDVIGEKLKHHDQLSEAKQKQLLERHAQITDFLNESGWYRRDSLAESTLLGLGFDQKDLGKKCEEFSGGWQMRIALAKAILQSPDILLLDEPTNYLDLEARNWLEDFLKDFPGGFLIVSHDRYFLDVTVNEVYELFNGELKHYNGNFSRYEKLRSAELEALMHDYEKQQEEISKLEDFIARNGYNGIRGAHAVQALERQKMLDKILEHKIEIPETLKKIHFSFPPAPHSGRNVLTLTNINKTWKTESGFENHIIKNLDLLVENGDRLVVAGRNGAGKSTLLRIIAGMDSDFSGEVKPGSGVSIGYFSQDSAEQMKGSVSILDMFEKECPLELIPKIRDMLGAFLFRGDDVYKSIDMLSGGEKSRLVLLRLLLKPVNLLILDEPTNHLDIHSKDVLLEALKDFGGTVIFVSHDRFFIESLATKVLELHPGIARLFQGDYKYYQERLDAEKSGKEKYFQTNSSDYPESAKAANVTSEKVSEKTEGRLSYEEKKKFEAEKRKASKLVENLENKITENETKLKELHNRLAEPEVYSNGEKAKEVQKNISLIETELSDLNDQWIQAAENLEKFL
jgi:ATP-binding cassette subfamily F protein 3